MRMMMMIMGRRVEKDALRCAAEECRDLRAENEELRRRLGALVYAVDALPMSTDLVLDHQTRTNIHRTNSVAVLNRHLLDPALTDPVNAARRLLTAKD